MIRSLGIAIAAVVALAAAAPAFAADKPAAPDLKIEAKNHEQGQKEAPAAAQAAGLTCTVTDGYFVAETNIKDDKGVPITHKIYEVSCKEGLGYMVLAPKTGPSKTYDCITTSDNPSLHCRLPANVDNKTPGAALAASVGKTCTISDVKPMGATSAGDTFFEFGCQAQLGFVLKRSADGKTQAYDCAQTLGTNLECKITTKAQIEAATKAIIDNLIAKSGKTCQVSGTRVVGSDAATGNSFYEVACGSAGGFMAVADKAGNYLRTVDCGSAVGIAGGCTLTDATVTQTAEAATYSKLSKASGFNCDVTKYRFIGTDSKTNSEVVEVACSNRPDGGIAVLPADNSPGKVYDCVMAGMLNQVCKLSDPSPLYDHYTQLLASKGKTTCKVSGALALGRTTTADLIETACSDGLPGWVIVVENGQAKDLLTCGQAKSSSLACKLPGNVR